VNVAEALLMQVVPRGTYPTNPPLPVASGGWATFGLAIAPYVGYAVLAPILWKFFGKTWKEIDAEATEARVRAGEAGTWDPRPAVMFATVVASLALQQYFAGREIYGAFVRPWLSAMERAGSSWVDVIRYGELYGYAWWALTRTFGYTVFPLAIWKICFPRDSLLDLGLRTRGFLKHAWIYGLCLAVVVPLVVIASFTPDFASYYPFYKKASRSWVELITWEVLYLVQFFGLELFFRGFMLTTLRKSVGSSAIFAMCVPYVMIHFGKPYLETAGAFVAGVALGTVAMRTRSIYSGFLVHATVALLMDGLALWHRGGFPKIWKLPDAVPVVAPPF
jgi:membrane protease YdiL (CAAX protease family)